MFLTRVEINKIAKREIQGGKESGEKAEESEMAEMGFRSGGRAFGIGNWSACFCKRLHSEVQPRN